MFESFDDFINEAGMNDPVLMAFRAAKMKREKELAKPKRKPLYGKQREKAEEALWVISQDLKDLYADRGQLLIDMEQEAEVEGGPVADRYGEQLDMIEDKIASLIKQRNKLEMKLAESVVTEASKTKMNNLDWGKTTADRNANQKKYDALETEEEREEFLKKLKNESVGEAAINEMDSQGVQSLADELNGEVYIAKLKNGAKSAKITATTTTKTWDDGAPILKYLAKGKSKQMSFNLYQRPFKVIHDPAHDWFYFTDGRKWYGLHADDGYSEASDLPFDMEIGEGISSSNVEINVHESATNESRIQLKRRYTENHPAITAGKQARIRNKMLEAIADGTLTEEEFKTILSEMTGDSTRWMRRNKKYFNVSEDGVSLSKFGRRALNQITINENMDKFIFESFGEFINAQNTEMVNEGTRGQVGIIDKNGKIKSIYTHYDSYPENVLPILKKHYKDAKSVEKIVAKGDSRGLDKPSDMEFYGGTKPITSDIGKIDQYMRDIRNEAGAEYVYLYDEIDQKWYMANLRSDARNKELVPAFESVKISIEVNEAKLELDAMDPEEKQLIRDLKKAKISYKVKWNGTATGFHTMELEGDKKAIKKIVDDHWGLGTWDDYKQYLEESVSTLNERVEFSINEAFKSSKLRNLINMDQSGNDVYGKSGKLAPAIYGMSKIKLDEIEDTDLIDVTPKVAYKDASKDTNAIVFYIVDNEKENTYADQKSYKSPTLKPGILAVSRGKDFLGVTYNQRDSRSGRDKRGNLNAYTMSKGASPVGGNKDYRGYDASGIYNIKRAADLADRAIVFYIDNVEKSANDLIQQRADAQSGAIAFKDDKDFKKANMARYKEILANKASKRPIDKMVQGAIEDLSKQIRDGLSKGEKGRYGDIIIGRNKRGSEIRLRDASNHMSNILDDYNRYVDYIAQAERDKESEYSTGYYERESKQYAKNISDKIRQIKSFDYAW
jgi:hypothetical protein